MNVSVKTFVYVFQLAIILNLLYATFSLSKFDQYGFSATYSTL